jgi:hypothetical protein
MDVGFVVPADIATKTETKALQKGGSCSCRSYYKLRPEGGIYIGVVLTKLNKRIMVVIYPRDTNPQKNLRED